MRSIIIAVALVVSLGTAWANCISATDGNGVPHFACDGPFIGNGKPALTGVGGAPVAPKEIAVDLGTSRDTMKFHGGPSDTSGASSARVVLGNDPLASRPGRAYTLDEIDRMRKAVFSLLTKGTNVCLFVIQYDGNQYCKDPSDTFVEVRLHTYMLAGISPEALEAKAKETK